jgi:tripartite-type tricarboxylate transporter receptor subunit TctC
MLIIVLLRALVVTLGLAGTAIAQAPTWPIKPVRIVVPFPSGGGVDFLARTMQNHFSEGVGQPIVVDNRPGAGGILGADMVAKSAPDGYTLLMGNSATHAINAAIHAKLPYDPVQDFVAVTWAVNVSFVLAAHPVVPVRSVRELVALAKRQPGRLNYASAGNGTATHLAFEMFKSRAGIEVVHVPYKGAGQAVIDLVGGQVSLMIGDLPTLLPLVRSGKLKALAVANAKRLARLPELPTVAESGFPGFVVISWQGLFAPAGTPIAIVARLHAEAVKVLNAPDVRDRLIEAGNEIVAAGPQEYAAHVRDEMTKWTAVAKATGAKVD